ncbi:MAG: hypothetical protein Q9166_004791 [cf. Caloplaca sp. 2 TL-2023]
MAVDVMRIPIAKTFAQADGELPHTFDILRKRSVDLAAASLLPQDQNPEVAAPRAAASSVLGPPSTEPAETLASAPSNDFFDTEHGNRRGSTANTITAVAVDGDIDTLINRLDQTQIQTGATKTPRLVQIPKGYTLGMDYDASRFYQHRSEARKFDKRKRDLGILPEQTGPQKHGFRPEELLYYNAVNLKDGCKDSNLENDIHPLLKQDRFDDTPDHIYDQLIPGLRLASLFLSHPSCMQFWVTLAKGERRVDHTMTARYHKPRHRISRNVPMTKENVKEVIGYMRDLGEAQAIHFTFAPGLTFGGSGAFGTAHTICNFQSDTEGRQAGNVQCCHVRLHSDFYVIAKKLSTMIYPDPAQKFRFNFIFATLIVHEMAHAIELSQWRNRAPSPFEPFLLHHNDAELGRMWESYMFGGQVSPINDRVDGLYGVGTWNWPRPFGEMDPERTICYAIPMTYIENIQQKSTWEKKYKLEDCQSRFHAPRDGASSIYMNSVTTVSWTEEERVAKESLREQRELQEQRNAEEPAKKKRETAGGQAMPVKEVGAEPEAVDEKLAERKEQGTVAQQVHRVKLEPKGVMSRRQWRMQKKMAVAKEEVEESPDEPEVLLDLEKPKEAKEMVEQVIKNGDIKKISENDAVVATDDNRGVNDDNEPDEAKLKTAKVNAEDTDAHDSNEDTKEKAE